MKLHNLFYFKNLILKIGWVADVILYILILLYWYHIIVYIDKWCHTILGTLKNKMSFAQG